MSTSFSGLKTFHLSRKMQVGGVDISYHTTLSSSKNPTGLAHKNAKPRTKLIVVIHVCLGKVTELLGMR